MGLVLSHYLDRAQPTPTARVKPDASVRCLPAANGSSAAAAPIRRMVSTVSAVARALLPAHDAPTRDRRFLVPSAVLLKGRGRDVDSLAGHERARAALGHIHAAVRDSHSSQGRIAAHKAARGINAVMETQR